MQRILLAELILFVILISGCITTPENIAKTSPVVKEFLTDYPEAEVMTTYFTEQQALDIIGKIRKECNNSYIKVSEFYRVTVEDAASGISVIVWINWKTRMTECVLKKGITPKCIEGKTITCGSDIGECQSGTQTCINGTWGNCVGAVGPTDELCDDLDNNCDGIIDEGCACIEDETRVCGSDIGICKTGLQTCVKGVWSNCIGATLPIIEVCDRLDNDCDGGVDEDCACIEGEIRNCGSNIGTCRSGTQTCINGAWGECTGKLGPVNEIYDGLDNDCDGDVDEDYACSRNETKTCGSNTGICETGIQTCINGTWGNCIGGIQPRFEICDGLDNNCDGVIDEGCTCTEGANRTCGSDIGVCKYGIQTCINNSWGKCAGGISPGPELCNGLDDNCNGELDEICNCTGNETKTCGSNTGICETGIQTCINGTWGGCIGGVVPATEVCDGLDNNCDGIIDEGCACASGATRSCGISGMGACTLGTQACSSGVWSDCIGSTGPSNEVCDSLDNNCDGKIDEGLTRQCGTTDVGVCQYGTQACSSGAWRTCSGNTEPATEICENNLDDDCDGSVDEGCQVFTCTDSDSDGYGAIGTDTSQCTYPLQYDCNDNNTNEYPGSTRLCGSNIGKCVAGTRTCQGSGDWTVCQGGIGPSDEVCDGLDNDCDGSVDEGFDLGGFCSAGIGKCYAEGVYICKSDGSGIECNAVPGQPINEICNNGLDDNCDGSIDENCIKMNVKYVGSCQKLNQTNTVYYLTQDIYLRNFNGNCFEIASPNIIFDGNGHSIKAANDGEIYNIGIFSNQNYITIRNVSIDMTDYWIHTPPGGGLGAYYGGGGTGIRLENCNNVGIYNNNLNMQLYGLYVKNCSNSRTNNNIINSNNRGILISGSNNAITNNVVNSNKFRGIEVNSASDNNIINNTINSNGEAGIYFHISSNNAIINNTIISSVQRGLHIYGSSYNRITGNTINLSGSNGIFIEGNSLNNNLTGNHICDNNPDLFCELEQTFTDNDCFSPHRCGKTCESGCGKVIDCSSCPGGECGISGGCAVPISNCAQLQNIKNDLTADYFLTQDIDCSGVGFQTIGSGNPPDPFKGTIDGKGHSIKNLYISCSGCWGKGIFQVIDSGAEIRDVNLTDFNINIQRNAGFLAYKNYGNIYNVNVIRGGIGCESYCGALVGENYGKIYNSHSEGMNLNGISYVGGLVGFNRGGEIYNSYSTNSVTGTDEDIGGLVGYNGGNIYNSYATGNVNGVESVGGLVGGSGGNISDSYSTGNVNGDIYVGGLVGEIAWRTVDIYNSYSTGKVVGDTDVGGLVGKKGYPTESEIINSYYNSETSGQSDTGKGKPKTIFEMKQQSTFVDWDFNAIWYINEGVDYPKLKWQVS